MQRFFNFCLATLAVCLFINLISCSPDECPMPTDPYACNSNGTCNRGYECINDSCQCPQPSMIFNNHCVQFGGTGPTWVGYSGGCYCFDTLAIGVSGTGENRTLFMPIASGQLVGSANTSIKYFERPDGDSIYAVQMPLACDKQGPDYVKVIARMYGKVQTDGDLFIRLEFRHPSTYEVIDECVSTMKKIK